jgi:hypothetical protein
MRRMCTRINVWYAYFTWLLQIYIFVIYSGKGNNSGIWDGMGEIEIEK